MSLRRGRAAPGENASKLFNRFNRRLRENEEINDLFFGMQTLPGRGRLSHVNRNQKATSKRRIVLTNILGGTGFGFCVVSFVLFAFVALLCCGRNVGLGSRHYKYRYQG